MTDFQLQPLARTCTVTGRELRPGEKVFSVLIDEAGRLTRRDFAAESWSGPPADAFGFWTGRVPAGDAPRRPSVDDELLLECVRRLDGVTDPAKLNFRYVVALMLMRRKRLRFEDAHKDESGETLALRCGRTGERFMVVDPGLSPAEIDAVQDEAARTFGWQ